MAREIIQRTWCDPCLAEDETRTEAEEVTVALGAAKARVFAVCERHKKELVEPLAQALNDYGVLPEKNKAKPGKADGGTGTADTFKCRYPGCSAESISEGGFTQHLYTYHNIGVVAHRQIASGEKTLEELGLEPYVPPTIPEVLICPAKKCGRDFTGDRRKGSLAAHLSKSHPDEWAKMGGKLVL